jgi:hypothetical protein
MAKDKCGTENLIAQKEFTAWEGYRFQTRGDEASDSGAGTPNPAIEHPRSCYDHLAGAAHF